MDMMCPLNICVHGIVVILQENLSQPLRSEDIDASSGILMPYYDFDTKVMFLAGKVCVVFLCIRVTFVENDNRSK